MPIETIIQEAGAQPHALPGDLTIYGVGALRSQFSAWLEKLPTGPSATALADTALPIDASKVSEADAAGVQLLIALSKSLLAYRRPLQLTDVSSTLAAACEALGVPDLLGLSATTGAAE